MFPGFISRWRTWFALKSCKASNISAAINLVKFRLKTVFLASRSYRLPFGTNSRRKYKRN